jgi:hypothetical protein
VLQPCGEATVRFVDREGNPIAGHDPWFEIVVTPGGYFEDHRWARRLGSLRADVDYAANVDHTNETEKIKSDADGRSHFTTLIPGATYRIRVSKNGSQRTATSFEARAGENIDLGDVVVDQ